MRTRRSKRSLTPLKKHAGAGLLADDVQENSGQSSEDEAPEEVAQEIAQVTIENRGLLSAQEIAQAY